MSISIQHISKTYSKTVALQDVTFDFSLGKVTGIIGANGSGKSTLIKCLIGELTPDKGQIYFDGGIANVPIGLCPEETFFYKNLSIDTNLELIKRLRAVKDSNEVPRVKKLLKIEGYSNKKIKSLSMGQQQRAKLAASLIGNPKIILFDEPHNGLDPTGFIDFRKIVTLLKSESATVVITSHLLHEVKSLCDEIIILDQGKFIQKIDLKENVHVDLEDFFKDSKSA